MSLNLTRRDAIKSAMAATAAIAAAPYLANLVGEVRAAPLRNAPKPVASPSQASGSAASAQNAQGTTVLMIKGDVVSSYSGLQTVKIQDAVLASRLRAAVHAGLD